MIFAVREGPAPLRCSRRGGGVWTPGTARSTLAWAWAGVLVLSPLLARSAPTPAPAQARAAASALFDDARRLMAKGRAAEACPKLEESQRLWPGIGTLFNLASCYEKVGRTASAWTSYREVLAQTITAGQAERVEVIRDRVRAIEPTLVRLVLDVASPVADLQVSRDGVDAAAPLWGIAVPVDPGTHVIRAAAPGYESWQQTITVEGRGKVVTVKVPRLARVSQPLAAVEPEPPPVAATRPEAPATGLVATQPARLPPPNPVRWQVPVGIAGMALGVAGMGGGVGIGFFARGKAATADCDASNVCSDAGIAQRAEAMRLGDIGTGVFIGGAVVAAAGALVLILAPPPSPQWADALQWGIGPGGLWVSGGF
jgi:hypothetical protein